jgi:lysozyme
VKTSAVGLAVVQAFEGCLTPVPGRSGYFKTYICPAGVRTIGWGSTHHGGHQLDGTTVWSKSQCDDALRSDLGKFERHVEKLAKVPLAQHEFDALVSWAYNTGGPATASLWRELNAGNKAAIPKKLKDWTKANGKVLKGLVRRRDAEAKLFAGDVNGALRVAGAAKLKPLPMPQKVDAPVKSPGRTGSAVVVGGGAVVATKKAADAYGWGVAIAIIAVVVIAGVIAWRLWPKKDA